MTDMERRRRPQLRGGCNPTAGRESSGAGADLVEAIRAVHRSVVAGEEGHERLSTALRAHRGVHLSLSAVAAVRGATDAECPVLLCDRAAALATLWLVDQALAGVELLLASGEDEVHPAVSTADGLVGVHPSQCLLLSHVRPELDVRGCERAMIRVRSGDRKSTRLNSSHLVISYAVFCLKKKK